MEGAADGMKTYLSPERAERMARHAARMRWQAKKRFARLAAGIKPTDPFYAEWSDAYDRVHPEPLTIGSRNHG